VGEAPDSWGAIFEPAQAEAHAGKIGLLNDSRDVIAAALMYLGYDPNSTNPDELEQAKQTILAIKPYVATFDSDTFADFLVSGDTVLTEAWGGNLAQAIADNPDSHIGYALPKEGSIIWTDNLAIPETAPNAYTAEVLINYLLDPEIGAQITNFTRYASPNVAAEPFIDEEVKSNPAIYPSQEALAGAHYLADLGEATQLYERIWTEIKVE
jgi:spermidine/putrescine transport system substrate-binding protein